MDDEDPRTRVPEPREGGYEHPGFPHVPAPRSAPVVESLSRTAGTVATMTERPAADDVVGSTALVRAEPRSAALVVRDDSVPSRLRALGRRVVGAVSGAVEAAVQGVRALLGGLGVCPVVRRGLA